ncbi:unnamed protein product [Rhizophagus irregularis]|nr:unnamed protein product [Rhizophagus irregularis]CAB5189142.1 unnamed protein product [Rhizophagus irregularis]
MLEEKDEDVSINEGWNGYPVIAKIKIVPDNENIVLTAKKVLNENTEFWVRARRVRNDWNVHNIYPWSYGYLSLLLENKIEISISKKLGKILSCNGY